MTRAVLVLGATGTVGSGIVKHFLKAGDATVIAPIRGTNLDKLFEVIGSEFRDNINLKFPNADYGTKAGVDTLAAWVKDNISGGQVDHIFSVGGGMAPFAAVSQISAESLIETIQVKLISILFAAQALVPLLKDTETSTFTIVTGSLGEYCFAPQFALTSIATAGVYGLATSLQAEAKASGKKYRINEFRIGTIILPDGEPAHRQLNIPGAQTSILAKYFNEHVAESDVRDSIIRVSGPDLGL